jgi:hypothetical protein
MPTPSRSQPTVFWGSRRATIAPTIRNGAVTTTMNTAESMRDGTSAAASISDARPITIASPT